MRLFTIGDSISQGYMSLAAARTDLAYSTLLALKLGLRPQVEYRFADWQAGGLPLNIEAILRRLNRRYGADISLFEWLTVLQTINDVVDEAEDYYERGAGGAGLPYGNDAQGRPIEFFHNVAVTGFKVADAWSVTPAICQQQIAALGGSGASDGYLRGPDAPGYRTALKVLNPSLDPRYAGFSQLDWLEHHAAGEGVENLVLWLGANNALGTVVNLKINQTRNDPNRRPHQLSHMERTLAGKWNLWHPDDFEAEYAELLRRVDATMSGNAAPEWKVFVGTVPLVTIAPLAKGVGETTKIPGKGVYYKYYTYFPFEERFARESGLQLSMQDAVHIDDCIRAFNDTIRRAIEQLNARHGRPRYFVVDIAEALNLLAYKRNDGQPKYVFPQHFNFVYPMVNTKYYHADTDGQLRQGGIFSLDGIHPTAIGHGLIAYEFLKVMQQAGVVADAELSWPAIFANDTLYTRPISIMQELYRKDDLAQHIVKLIQLFGS